MLMKGFYRRLNELDELYRPMIKSYERHQRKLAKRRARNVGANTSKRGSGSSGLSLE